MSTITGKLSISSSATRQENSRTTPAEAVRRLNLTRLSGKNYADIVELDATDLGSATRVLNRERETLTIGFNQGDQAIAALTKIEELVGKVSALVKDASGSGLSRGSRAQNQKEIDRLVKEIAQTAEDAGTTTTRVLNGRAILQAGKRSLRIEKVELSKLGQAGGSGRSVNFSDLQSRGELDTVLHRTSTRSSLALQSTKQALIDVQKLKTDIQTFQKEELRPRLGDIATAFDAIYSDRASTLTNSTEARQTAVDIRVMLLGSASLAASVGAEGWDRARVLELVGGE